MKLFISPHNDDETLFGAFTILRDHPLVLIVTDSSRQSAKGITAFQRRSETMDAMAVLGVKVDFLGIPDAELNFPALQDRLTAYLRDLGPVEHIYVPAFEPNGNCDHNIVAGVEFESTPVTRYLTYTTLGKSRSAVRVPFEKEWPILKLQALACYVSQLREPSCLDHFLREQYEFYEA